ncbi:MAG: 30S ribosomal protein S3 [Eubacteriales bacterium]|nr:30S ribosomal protein S3 [Bacillota bacterium]MBV1728189.1 30S ribosomal protein S3 [Desulforudis sp.]MDZ4043428.1 30S ribosomal protein S3 [Eubacteriales bacterium]MBU4533908.1 30S ribosomal protein S3 [Bacillota bacterium]MBU4554365.1 30S ribosomal protein S3 [Bacillota bacterium]
MGQKVDPRGLRLGIVRDWDAKWFANKKNFSDLLIEDVKLREFIKKKLYPAGIARVQIERTANRVRIAIHTAKPGIVIGRGGTEVEALRKTLEKMSGRQVSINIVEIKAPELDAQLVAENVAAQLVRRIAFRRAMKQAVGRSMKMGAKGIRIAVSGRLGGAEIARSEWYSEGKVPLHTLRADIDYGFAEAKTTYGKIGIKVWIYRGEVLPLKARQGGK